MTPLDRVLDALGTSSQTGTLPGRYAAICPAHDDSRESLSVRETESGTVLIYCHAGCATKDVVSALGLEFRDLWPEGKTVSATVAERNDTKQLVDVYTYVDQHGTPLYRVNRTAAKTFWQEHPVGEKWMAGLNGVERVPYRLDQASGDTVWLFEGEKDAENAAQIGLEWATTLLGGAGKWRPEYVSIFNHFKQINVVCDNDEAGRNHGVLVEQQLREAGSPVNVTLLRAADGCKDFTDHLNQGLGADDLLPLYDGSLESFELGEVEWAEYEPPPVDWLFEPYIPKGGRILAFGQAGSLKSLWAMWLSAKLAEQGRRVCYITLEMRLADAVTRIKKLAPPSDNFKLLTNFKIGHPYHTELLSSLCEGYDLIVLDSWNASFGSDGRNEDIVRIDNEVLQPVIDRTGAAFLVLDNTGHDAITDSGKIKADHARGASAKGDKMEMTLWFHRPDETNNYRTTVRVKKVRMDVPVPEPVTIETPNDEIEFYFVGDDGTRTGRKVWDDKVYSYDGTTALALDGAGRLREELTTARAKQTLRETTWESDVS